MFKEIRFSGLSPRWTGEVTRWAKETCPSPGYGSRPGPTITHSPGESPGNSIRKQSEKYPRAKQREERPSENQSVCSATRRIAYGLQ